MKAEELAEEQKLCLKAQGFKEDVKAHDIDVINAVENKLDAYKVGRYDGFLAGLKAGRPQWHKITDWKNNSQFPKDELKTYLVRLYQDHYVMCELDIYRQFYLPDNLEDIDPKDVIAWCEIPVFDKE